MKILWVNPHFLHPTNKGGQIRTLEMLRWLNRWHEVHYVALDKAEEPEGYARSSEYSAKAYAIPHRVPPRGSLAFLRQAAAELFSPLPLAVSRYRSTAMRALLAGLLERERFDRLVCDFLFVAPNIPCLARSVLFQHNVETSIWQRHLENARDPVRRAFFQLQLNRMMAYEAEVCRSVARVVAVSDEDAARFGKMFGIANVSTVPTGVDVERFTPPAALGPLPHADFVFLGSMDWLPNIDGASWFEAEVLPLIRQRMSGCTFAIVGRTPAPALRDLARKDPGITVTGTVPDTRPWLWGSTVSVVPLRIGGGTRLKIFEAMAARIPIVSTSIGAEGLPVASGHNIFLADSPQLFADRCIELVHDAGLRSRIALAAWDMVSSSFSWKNAAQSFDNALQAASPA